MLEKAYKALSDPTDESAEPDDAVEKTETDESDDAKSATAPAATDTKTGGDTTSPTHTNTETGGSSPGGATSVSIHKYDGCYKAYRLDVDPSLISKFVENLELKQNRGYDYGQIFSIAMEDLFHIKIKAQNKRLTICSEIVYEAAQEAGIPVPPVSQAYITPGDFLNWTILIEVKE
jgi:hypothetical protein